MGMFEKMFGKSKPPKSRDLTSPEAMAEEKAYREEKSIREKAIFAKKIKKAEQRGRDRATPFTEKAGKAIAGAGKGLGNFITSPGFQRYARAGAAMTQERPRSNKKHRKGKKQSKSSRREMRHDPLSIGDLWGR